MKIKRNMAALVIAGCIFASGIPVYAASQIADADGNLYAYSIEDEQTGESDSPDDYTFDFEDKIEDSGKNYTLNHVEYSVISAYEEKYGDAEIPATEVVKEDKIIMAGPCAIESYEQLLETAKFVKSQGANVLRGGAFKPRTSPNSFKGLKEEGLEILKAVKEETGLAVITELMDIRDLEKLYEVSDIIQIGSRNMQNFTLLTEIGKQDKPIMLKRGIAATISEWIGAAEYIAVEGNNKIIMCERGIRTYNDYTRNTLDLAAVPIIQKETNLPVIVDPSHGTGVRYLVKPMSLAAFACGADGLMIEVHPNPSEALSDGMQSLHFDEFEDLMKSINVNTKDYIKTF